MALRIEKRITAALIVTAALAAAQPFTYVVRHQHLHGGETGTLRVGLDSIAFEEQGKHAAHSHEWKYSDIQQLSLSATELHILTYEDRKWQFGRDRDYVFDQLPEGLSKQLYPLFARNLDQRFVAELSDAGASPIWEMPVKLRHGLGGSQGTLLIGQDRIVYRTDAPGESRTWRYADIDSVSTGGLFDLSLTTLERTGWRHAGPTEFRFELKQALHEDRYNDLWRRINRSRILTQNENPNL
jgi:hypothetical protein